MPLQFGHGTEPWRNNFAKKQLGDKKDLQFGHGTEPWRNLAAHVKESEGNVCLQFGHGTEPWRNRSERRPRPTGS